MAESGAGRLDHDGTQAAPPPPLFPDPLAGLVTGEHRYRPRTAAPVVTPVVTPVVPSPVPPPAPASPLRPVSAPPARRAAVRGQAPGRAPARHVSGEPAAHAPHAELNRRPPRQDAVQEGPKKGRSGLVGCLMVLVVLGGLLFNVVREIIEAVIDLVR